MFEKFIKKFVKFSLVTAIFLVVANIFPDTFEIISTANADDDAIEQVLARLRTSLNIEKLIEIVTSIKPFMDSLSSISYPVLVAMGYFLDNQVILNPSMADSLLTVWAQVRNLVNYIVVFYFVFIAIYNVFSGSTESTYSLKKGIKEVILTLVVINFSYYGAIFALDASNVLINISYSWVSEVDSISLQQNAKTAYDNFCDQDPNGCETEEKKQFESFLNNTSKQALPMIMAMKFGKLWNINNFSTLNAKTPFHIAAVVYLKFILAVIQVASFVLLTGFLIIRLIICWIYIAMSPLIVADSMLTGLDLDASSKLKEFFTYAIVAPVKIGIGMSLSYIFLDALQKTPSLGADNFVTNLQVPLDHIGSFQEIIIMIASIAMMYEITLSAADNTYAQSLFGNLRNRIEGFGNYALDKSLSLGTVMTPKGSSVKNPLDVFLPNRGTGSSGRGSGSGDGSGPSTSTSTSTKTKAQFDTLINTKGRLTSPTNFFDRFTKKQFIDILNSPNGLNALNTNSYTKILTYQEIKDCKWYSGNKTRLPRKITARIPGNNSSTFQSLNLAL